MTTEDHIDERDAEAKVYLWLRDRERLLLKVCRDRSLPVTPDRVEALDELIALRAIILESLGNLLRLDELIHKAERKVPA